MCKGEEKLQKDTCIAHGQNTSNCNYYDCKRDVLIYFNIIISILASYNSVLRGSCDIEKTEGRDGDILALLIKKSLIDYMAFLKIKCIQYPISLKILRNVSL